MDFESAGDAPVMEVGVMQTRQRQEKLLPVIDMVATGLGRSGAPSKKYRLRFRTSG